MGRRTKDNTYLAKEKWIGITKDNADKDKGHRTKNKGQRTIQTKKKGQRKKDKEQKTEDKIQKIKTSDTKAAGCIPSAVTQTQRYLKNHNRNKSSR